MAQNFVAELPTVSRADLVYGNQCGICREDYGTNIAGSDIVTEDAVRLPCGHEFGFECLSRWLSPNGGKNSCPNCRHVLFHSAPTTYNGVAQVHFDNIFAEFSDIGASIESAHDNILANLSDIAMAIESAHANLYENDTHGQPNRAPLPTLPPLPPVLTAQRPGLRGADPVAPNQQRRTSARSRRWL